MTLDEFRRHPAYDYYIRTLVSDCLICELDNKFDYKYKNIVYIKPNFENETKDYIIRVPREIIEESEEYIQFLIAYDNYKDLEYIRKDNEFYFYLKTYSMSDINQLKHFDVLNYEGEYFTNELKDGEEFLYSTIKIQDDSKVTFLCKYESNKHIQSCNYCPLVRYLCLGIDCRAVILKQVKHEKK